MHWVHITRSLHGTSSVRSSSPTALDKLEKDTSPGSRKKQQQQEEQRQKQSPKPTCPESLFHTWMACLPHPDADTIV
jgi:hypothetical protein